MHGAYLSLSKPADDPKGALEGSRASRAQGFADRQIVDNHAGGSSGKLDNTHKTPGFALRLPLRSAKLNRGHHQAINQA